MLLVQKPLPNPPAPPLVTPFPHEGSEQHDYPHHCEESTHDLHRIDQQLCHTHSYHAYETPTEIVEGRCAGWLAASGSNR